MATYVNNLRLKEIATGDESGTWGTSTNTNLELIGEALGVGTEAIPTNANTHTTTVADGASDAGRSLYIKYTGALDSDCTVTIAPDTMKRVHIIENATTDSGSSGPYNIIISQGSGSNVTIANGKVAVVQLDGAGSGAAVLDVFTDLQVTDTLSVNGTTITLGDGTAEDTKLVFDGNAQDFYVGLDDSADDLVIGKGSAVGTNPAIEIDENMDVKFAQSIGVGQAASSTTGDIVAQTMSLLGTTPTLTLGDGGEEDVKIQFDGVKDFYIANDDSADKLVIGEGSTVGTNSILTITDDTVTLGDGAAADTALIYDGNAKDFYLGLDDSEDKFVVGVGSTVGTNNILTLDDDSVTIGDGAEVDTKIVFDGNAQDFYVGLDDSADDLLIGNGSTVGSNVAIGINASQVVQFNGAYTFPTSDGSADQVLKTNGSGALSFGSVSAGTPTSISDADGDTKVQVEESSDEDIIRFDTAGTERATIDNGGILKITTPHASGGARIVLQSSDASDADDEDYGSIAFQNNGDTTLAQISGVSEGSANNKSHLRFSTKSGSGALTQQMLIRDNNLIQISGALSKGSGSFEIPHPLDSKKGTHFLRHSFIEGPQCDNIYRGTVALSGGSASVNLDSVSGMTDGTFVALNTDVQVFTTNETDWDSVKGSVSGNVLTISCQNSSSTATVSWLVIGERQDDVIVSSPLTDGSGKLILEPEIFEGGT